MAVVYRALYTAAPGVTKPVVIKRVLGTYAEDPAFVEMFLNEARISVGLSHGNIVQVFDFGKVDDEYYLAMELVDGNTLGRVLKAARMKGLTSLPAPLAVGIALEMCKGLHHAHTRLDGRGEPLGVVHRDLSPDNVLMSYEGEVKLTDFGIAKARLAGRPETEVGIVKGKYLYFSPEQARGEALDARSDVYTVGTVLFQMLCGQRPAEGSEFEVMRKISEGELTPALSLNPTLDTDLQSILKLALATSREKRYLSAEALQQSLSDWMGFRAPRFPANARKHFMAWLFQEELAALKRPAQVPADFLSQLQSWRGRGATPLAQDGAGRAETPLSPPRMSPMGRPALPVDGDSATRPLGDALPPGAAKRPMGDAPQAGAAKRPTGESVQNGAAKSVDEAGTSPTHASLRSRFRARMLRRSAVVKVVLAGATVGVLSLVGTAVFWISHARAGRDETSAATTTPSKPDGVTSTSATPASGPLAVQAAPSSGTHAAATGAEPTPTNGAPATVTGIGPTPTNGAPATATGTEQMPTNGASATTTGTELTPTNGASATTTGTELTPTNGAPATATGTEPMPTNGAPATATGVGANPSAGSTRVAATGTGTTPTTATAATATGTGAKPTNGSPVVAATGTGATPTITTASGTSALSTANAQGPEAASEPTAPDAHSPEEQARLALENGLYWTSRADDNRAMGWFQKCVRIDPSQPRCHLELARIYSRRGAIRDAMKHFTHHLALEPDGPSADEARRYLKLYATSARP
ncbi:protein kinase [Pyxidicoccus parkwayensis]|uniref:non-specific serine/threonine protein kinase n=2 Tax=Pyxidicoccus parkwayensis TaxID=2813578 RepID=A0ABX7PCF6_9BACT|nr:protein kinase [Pyxidicoccus parkwaysis]